MNEIGGLKKPMPAWREGERSEEGLKIGEKVIIKDWPGKGVLLECKVEESWRTEEHQFFIVSNLKQGSVALFMGAICGKNEEAVSELASEIEKEMNHRLAGSLPCLGLGLKETIVREEECIAFLFNLFIRRKNAFYTRKENKKVEERLKEAIREFAKRRKTERPINLPGEQSNSVLFDQL